MTRINCIPVQELTREHLVAEYRELPRIFSLARKAYERGERPDDPRNPTEYRLGTGHVRFFYNKLAYLRERHDQLCDEMELRGYATNLRGCWFDHATPDWQEWWDDWEPDQVAMAINRGRIADRLAA